MPLVAEPGVDISKQRTRWGRWRTHLVDLRGLTFELSCPRRQALKAWYAMMHHVLRTRLTVPAVAGQLERGVRPQRGSDVVGHLAACKLAEKRLREQPRQGLVPADLRRVEFAKCLICMVFVPETVATMVRRPPAAGAAPTNLDLLSP